MIQDTLEIYRKIYSYIIDGEVRQADGDSGDSAQRDGTLWAIIGMVDPNTVQIGRLATYDRSMRNHEVYPGYYRRTCNPNHWGYNGNNCSADQVTILRLAFAVHKDKKRLIESMFWFIPRLGFHQNYKHGTDNDSIKIPDYMRPNEISVFIRGMNFWLLYPILMIFDIGFLLDLYFRKGSSDYDNMLFQQLAYAQLKLPTPISKLAWKLYDREDALIKIKRYHEVGPEKNGIGGFYELFELLNRKVG